MSVAAIPDRHVTTVTSPPPEAPDRDRPAGSPAPYRWRPIEEAEGLDLRRRRGLLAHLTAFFVAYHTA